MIKASTELNKLFLIKITVCFYPDKIGYWHHWTPHY